jgi:hypothetical protein
VDSFKPPRHKSYKKILNRFAVLSSLETRAAISGSHPRHKIVATIIFFASARVE